MKNQHNKTQAVALFVFSGDLGLAKKYRRYEFVRKGSQK